MVIANLPFRVYSARPAQLEEGQSPFLEATFSTEQEATAFVAEWNRLYKNSGSEVEFFIGL